MRVLKAGAHTSIQDTGRFGYQKYGVIVSGAMDPFALRTANLLVGNDEDEAGLEVTLQGPALEMQQDVWISICGADLSAQLDGQLVPQWRPVFARKGATLHFGKPRAGCRAYVAVAGGFAVSAVLGSKSTYLRAGIGGYGGRALQAGDELPIGELKTPVQKRMQKFVEALSDGAFATTGWCVSARLFPAYSDTPEVRVVRGPEYALFTPSSQEAFVSTQYVVTPQSDRMGYRLEGPPLSFLETRQLISTAVTWGTVQVPADGKPIVLMADRQTTGGYPRIAQVITADIPVLAQLKPGAKVGFTQTTVEDAQAILRRRQQEFSMLKMAIEDSWER